MVIRYVFIILSYFFKRILLKKRNRYRINTIIYLISFLYPFFLIRYIFLIRFLSCFYIRTYYLLSIKIFFLSYRRFLKDKEILFS